MIFGFPGWDVKEFIGKKRIYRKEKNSWDRKEFAGVFRDCGLSEVLS